MITYDNDDKEIMTQNITKYLEDIITIKKKNIFEFNIISNESYEFSIIEQIQNL